MEEFDSLGFSVGSLPIDSAADGTIYQVYRYYDKFSFDGKHLTQVTHVLLESTGKGSQPKVLSS